MSDWQPIETAPKDGTWILIYPETGRVTVAQFHVEYGGTDDPAERLRWKDSAGFYSIKATHWMALPSPPSRERRGGLSRAAEAS